METPKQNVEQKMITLVELMGSQAVVAEDQNVFISSDCELYLKKGTKIEVSGNRSDNPRIEFENGCAVCVAKNCANNEIKVEKLQSIRNFNSRGLLRFCWRLI